MNRHAIKVSYLLQNSGITCELTWDKPTRDALRVGAKIPISYDWEPEEIFNARKSVLKDTANAIIGILRERYEQNELSVMIFRGNACMSFSDARIPEDPLECDFPSIEEIFVPARHGIKTSVSFSVSIKINGKLKLASEEK